MKKNLLVFICLALGGCLGLQAQNLKQNAIKKAIKQTWWGYYDGESENRTILGTGIAETYDVCIFIPGDRGIAVNKEIAGVELYLRKTDVFDDFKIWFSSTLPANVDEADYGCELFDDIHELDAESGDEGRNTAGIGWRLRFEEGFVMPPEGIYCGYSFTVKDISVSSGKYPVVVTPASESVENGMFLRTDKEMRNEWQVGHDRGWGNLCYRVLLKGEEYTFAAQPKDFGQQAAEAGRAYTVPVTITNMGSRGVRAIEYTVTTDSVESEPLRYELEQPFTELYADTTLLLPFPAEAQVGTTEKTITITRVGAMKNEAPVATAKGTVTVVSKLFPRGVLVEELTGVTCSWCPRGYVGMELWRQTYGPRFVGIALHQYSDQDAMWLPYDQYAPHTLSGAPVCQIDREYVCDPLYGYSTNGHSDMPFMIETLANTPPAVGISAATKIINRFGARSVEVTATLESIEDGDYRIEYVLLADSLSGTGSQWEQQNSYIGYDHYMSDPNMDVFCKGGKWGEVMVPLKFNDVAVGSSYEEGVNQATQPGTLAAGEVATLSYTLRYPSGELGRKMKDDNVAVAIIVTDKDGKVVNALKKYASPTSPMAVTTVEAETAEPAFYSLDGRRLSSPRRGLTIVRQSDGSTRKMLAK
ncbi:MAG: hypothetical protein IJV45_06470 [Prevotella sp.]|nr:hypothetical protein [Prevotella sp.]